MKQRIVYLNCIKTKCFMLVVCFTLLMGVTSCNDDDFEVNDPNEQKELSNAELIESALNRMPQTRANAPFPVLMVTTKKTITVYCWASEDMVIDWGDGSTSLAPEHSMDDFIHTYTDDQPSHAIFLKGSDQAIEDLSIYNNELIYLDVTNNIKLRNLLCNNNKLDVLDLTNCPDLKTLWADHNNISSIDVTHLPKLEQLTVSYNQLTGIDVTKNPNLLTLWVGGNPITDLDLTKNTVLGHLSLNELSINTINNLPISGRSFAAFPQLQEISISYTPFTSLDLSSNPLVYGIVITGTPITQLDISNLHLRYLVATGSNLTNLTYTPNNLQYAYELRINYTPFEELSSNMYPFITALPNKNPTSQGRLYTNSLTLVNPFLPYLTAKNWVVNQ